MSLTEELYAPDLLDRALAYTEPEVKWHPILFSPPMSAAIRTGRKTVTRRAVKWDGPKGYPHSFDHATPGGKDGFAKLWVPYSHPRDFEQRGLEGMLDWGQRHPVRPRYAVGDRLWVRERMRVLQVRNTCHGVPGADYETEVRVLYEADGAEAWVSYPERLAADPDSLIGKCLPYGGHREASRTSLELTGVEAERLHAITEDDAQAEGVSYIGQRTICLTLPVYHWDPATPPLKGYDLARVGFQDLWTKINGAESWAANPWVWVYRFRLLEEAGQ